MSNTTIELAVTDDLPDLGDVVLDGEANLLAPYLKHTVFAILEWNDDNQGSALHAGEHG